LTRSAGTTTTYHQLICGGDPSCEVRSFGGDATVLADYALTTTTTTTTVNFSGEGQGERFVEC